MTIGAFWREINELAAKFDGSVTSGHRTAAHNAAVGGAESSQHRGFRAVDIVLDDWGKKDALLKAAAAAGFWVLDETATKNHVHLDDRNNR
jgi:uncharacterized protein YcbK (DUF882 family)